MPDWSRLYSPLFDLTALPRAIGDTFGRSFGRNITAHERQKFGQETSADPLVAAEAKAREWAIQEEANAALPSRSPFARAPEPPDELEQFIMKLQMAEEANRMAQASQQQGAMGLGVPYSPLRREMGISSPMFDAPPSPVDQMRGALNNAAAPPMAQPQAPAGAAMEQPKAPGEVKGKMPRGPSADEQRGMKRFGANYNKHVSQVQADQDAYRTSKNVRKYGIVPTMMARKEAGIGKQLGADAQMRQSWMDDPSIQAMLNAPGASQIASPGQQAIRSLWASIGMGAPQQQAAPPGALQSILQGGRPPNLMDESDIPTGVPSGYAYQNTPYNQMNKTQAKLKYGSPMQQPRDPNQEFLAWLGTLPF